MYVAEAVYWRAFFFGGSHWCLAKREFIGSRPHPSMAHACSSSPMTHISPAEDAGMNPAMPSHLTYLFRALYREMGGGVSRAMQVGQTFEREEGDAACCRTDPRTSPGDYPSDAGLPRHCWPVSRPQLSRCRLIDYKWLRRVHDVINILWSLLMQLWPPSPVHASLDSRP